MSENKFTPASLAITDLSFTIPLYQRLFEWDEKEIIQLLNDLYNNYKLYRSEKKPYYIGMLTVYKEQFGLSLVDGQQRFTVLNLMALAFGGDEWKKFLTNNNTNRLSFFARKKDDIYLKGKINHVEQIGAENKKMEVGIGIIKKFISDIDNLNYQDDFKKYIFEYTTFFISYLPENYVSQDLNKYFEAMNAGGRSLENHEILKVDLLKKVSPDKQDHYTKIWNSISQMEKCLIRQKAWDKEKIDDYRKRISSSLGSFDSTELLYKLCNDDTKDNVENFNLNTIRHIPESKIAPTKRNSSSSENAILSFSEFLLQILWLQLSEEERKSTNDFFNTHKLQETFKTNLPDTAIELFFVNLLKYRLIFDQFILRINQGDQNNFTYLLNFSDSDSDYECEKLELTRLLQYQSMLYVSTSSHIWLSKTLVYLAENGNTISAINYLKFLKAIDNTRHDIDNLDLSYRKIDRYWFWRLDYYLWESRVNYFDKETIKIANMYLFKANRSIEHVAPQTPKRHSEMKISVNLMDSFGNLAMISAGQNSSLQNEPFEVKRAHVDSFLNGNVGGTIESLKLLMIHQFNNWNDENLNEHMNSMITVLINSFVNEENLYEKVISRLKEIMEVNSIQSP